MRISVVVQLTRIRVQDNGYRLSVSASKQVVRLWVCLWLAGTVHTSARMHRFLHQGSSYRSVGCHRARVDPSVQEYVLSFY